jgi:hypothetical protein
VFELTFEGIEGYGSTVGIPSPLLSSSHICSRDGRTDGNALFRGSDRYGE